ncbi:MAG: DUF4845 domain-containing protein [Gammaproteobacteria bacterium]|nr:DUF4845 domain-containing protein [Gammaproteobacteria bacterium]
MQRRQRGMSAIGIFMVLVLLVFAALIGMRVTPAYLEYFAIKKAIASMTQSGELRGGTVADVRKAFDRHQAIDDFTAIGPQDLEITKDGGELVISFAYEKRVPLFYNISLIIDFAGSSDPSRAKRRAD